MADITMCQDKECCNFATCYRAQATANPYRQAYYSPSPRTEGQPCLYYAPMQYSDGTSAVRND